MKPRQLFFLIDPISARFIERMRLLQEKEVNDRKGEDGANQERCGEGPALPASSARGIFGGESMSSKRSPAIVSGRGENKSTTADSLGAGHAERNIFRQNTALCQADFFFDRDAGPGERLKEE